MNVSSPAPSNAVSLPRPPVDDVIAVAAEQHVVSVAAGDHIVARTAVDCEVDEMREPVAGRDDIVATIRVDDEVLRGADVDGERRGADAIERARASHSP